MSSGRREGHALLGRVRHTFRSVATAVVPEAESLDARDWEAVESIVEQALASRPARVRRQLVLFLRLLSLLSLPRHGRRFAALSKSARISLLDELQRSRITLLRRGTWGVRTLVFMGYYARPEAAAAIGYRADPRGWEARQ